MKINIGKKDIIWGYLGTFMSMSANALLLPFILYFLDGDLLGLWYIFVSIGAIASLFDFGFSVTFARNITYCWSGARKLQKENVEFSNHTQVDFVMMRDVLTVCRRIYLVISMAAFSLMLFVGTPYIIYVSEGIRSYDYLPAWLIYMMAVFLNLYYGYYASFLRGVGDIEDANKNMIISRMAQIIVTILLLFAGMGLLGASIGYLIYGGLFRGLGKYKFFHYQNIGRSLKNIPGRTDRAGCKELFSVVWHNAWRDGIVGLSDYFSNQVGTLICSLYLSLTDTGSYSLGMQIATAVSMIAASLYSTYQPVLQSAYINHDKNRMRSTMSLLIYCYFIVFFVGMIGTALFIEPILKFIKSDNMVSISILLALYFYQFILRIRNCYASYFSCTNRLPYVRSFVVSSILCVGFSVLFMGPLHGGIWGLIFAQIISQMIFNVWYWPIQVHKELECSLWNLIKEGHMVFWENIRKRKNRTTKT